MMPIPNLQSYIFSCRFFQKNNLISGWLFASIIILSYLSSFGTNHLSPDSLAYRLAYQQWLYPQEKVFIATDRDVYTAGDTIRFRVFLVDAYSLRQLVNNGSRYVYVELEDPFGETIRRVKIRNQNGMFAGILPLPEEMAEGTYTLGSYTLFMKNQSSDYIFRKILPIRSQLSKKYDLKCDVKEESLITELKQRFSGKPVNASKVELSSADGILRNNINNRSKQGFRITEKMRDKGVVKVKYDRYEKFVRIPVDTGELSISFHPEGGHLINGVENKIGFKVIGKDGLGKHLRFDIFDSDGNRISTVETEHRGMGSFSLIPEAGKEYHAEVTGMSFKIPKAASGTTSLKVIPTSEDSVEISIIGERPEVAILLANNCGIPQYYTIMGDDRLKIARRNLGTGLVQLLLANGYGNILSSRLIFNRSGYLWTNSDKVVPNGDYAIRISTNDIEPSQTNSIVGELLLQSEIKGYVEDPDYYFSNPDALTDNHLDNLLLTQGWQRYDVQAAVHGDYQHPDLPVEIGGSISGSVRTRWTGKPMANATINVLAPAIGYAGITVTDSLGRYTIDGLDWPDGTAFAIQAFNSNGKREHNHDVDQDESLPFNPLTDDSQDINRNPSYIPENDNAVWLEELEVTAAPSDEELRKMMLNSLGVRIIDYQTIEKENFTSYEQLILRKFPGLRIENGSVVSNRGRSNINMDGTGGYVEFWIDGTRWEVDMGSSTMYDDRDLKRSDNNRPIQTFSYTRPNILYEFENAYPIHVIKSIEYYPPFAAAVISGNAAKDSGALVFTTKDGSEVTDPNNNIFIHTLRPLGYQTCVEAYSPHYVYDPTDRLGAPLHEWYPSKESLDNLNTPDGKRIVINGISHSGIPVYKNYINHCSSQHAPAH